MRPPPLIAALAAAALLALAACADGSGTGVETAAAASISVLDGDEQEALVFGTLPEPLRARVVDRDGDPVSGVTVYWSATGGTLSARESTTDASGIASVQWVMRETDAPSIGRVGRMQATASLPSLPAAGFTAWSRRGVERHSVTITPAEVNVASGPATVTVSVHVTTDIGSVTEGAVRFTLASGEILPYTRVYLVEGNDRDGVWRGVYEVPQGTVAGEWQMELTMGGDPQGFVSWGSAPQPLIVTAE